MHATDDPGLLRSPRQHATGMLAGGVRAPGWMGRLQAGAHGRFGRPQRQRCNRRWSTSMQLVPSLSLSRHEMREGGAAAKLQPLVLCPTAPNLDKRPPSSRSATWVAPSIRLRRRPWFARARLSCPAQSPPPSVRGPCGSLSHSSRPPSSAHAVLDLSAVRRPPPPSPGCLYTLAHARENRFTCLLIVKIRLLYFVQAPPPTHPGASRERR